VKAKKSSAFSCLLGLLAVALIVQLLSWTKGDRVVFPDLIEILRAFFKLLGQGRTYQLIFTTLVHLFVSLLISSFAGILIGLLEGFFELFYKILRPLMTLLRSIPIIVLVVIIMVLTKYENVPYIATCLVLLPLISEAAREGVKKIKKEQSELIDVYLLNSNFSPRILALVYFPLMAGFLRQSYVNAVGMGIKIIVTTEYLVQTKNSLGKAVNTSIYFNEYAEIYAYALIMIFLVILLTELPKLIKFAVNKVVGDASR